MASFFLCCFCLLNSNIYKQVVDFLVQVADAISSARPGARRESLELYVKRLEQLESIANSFKGVDKTYAIQAGREVRIIVKPDEVDDKMADFLAKDIAKRIEAEMEYPGQIKDLLVLQNNNKKTRQIAEFFVAAYLENWERTFLIFWLSFFSTARISFKGILPFSS